MAEASNAAESPFSPLDPSLRQIRLLRIEPNPSDLSAVLETVSLDDGPKYTALSYTWGTEMSSGAGIALNGQGQTWRLPITRNLEVVLEHLCASGDGKPITLWIDALCINQTDVEEKSHQITLMRDVYSGAEATCLWLGPAADNSDLAMATIGELFAARTYVLPDGALSEAHIEAINALQRREWWSRIWVLQEAMLSPSPIVRCGSATLPFEAFVHLDDIRLGYIRPERRSLDNASGGSRFLIQGSPFRQILTHYPDEKPRVRAGITPLAEYVHMVDQFKATNPRDKIYGLLGLGMPSDVHFLAPNYSQSVADVYTRATARFIIQYQELIWLQFDNDNKSPRHALPSWCPDYSTEPGRPPRGYTAITAVGPDAFCASGSSCWGVARLFVSGIFPTPAWDELHLRGLDFDDVEYVGPNPFVERYMGNVLAERMENVRAVLAKWQRDGFPYAPLGLGQSEAFWRALMWDRDWDKNKVPLEHGRYFDAWLGRADVDASYAAANSSAGMDEVEVRRTFVKPFTDCCISRSHGRSFVITKRGYIGLAPFKTCVGDKVTVLQGGTVPFVLRERAAAPGEGFDGAAGQVESTKLRCEFVGEAFVLGIMEGQAVSQAREEEVKVFILT
ncbi:hypothetical protein INS49_008034 [Diaporthe citri]|uniref:uncharacterized protein n=1 Tax=Diaporthe citri TaxID=83186 RepID=UPI001C80E6B0|nr:uncharacterized protein INS49_008034 [Diaporthe citri]KAG6362939.1 hypothetical protein INS49_008034 [Diaporthe citri]